MLEVELFPRP